jgi:hypothetical protein
MPPRRHHYLPQMYQRAFANARGQVRVFHVDGSRDYTTSTANAFAEHDYYTVASVDADVDHEIIESGVYAKAETIADPSLKRLVAGTFPPSTQDRMDVAGFMALQVTRGPHFRRFSDHVSEKLGEAMQMGMAMAPDEYWEGKRLEWEAGGREGPEPPGPFTSEQKKQLAQGGLVRFRSTKQDAVEMSFVAFEEITNIFFMMDWTLVSFTTPWLLSGPLPVVYWRRDDGPLGSGIGPITAEEVVMPLSPSRALVLTHPPVGTDPATVGDRDRLVDGDQANAAHLNAIMLQWNDVLLLCPDVPAYPLPDSEAGIVVGALSAPFAERRGAAAPGDDA